MRILVIEYTVGLKESVDSHLFPEGFAMLRTMVEEFKGAGFEVMTTLHRDLEKFDDWLEADQVYRENELEKAINRDPDAVLPIAPEGKLRDITKKMREEGINVLGADEKSIEISKDKWSTYLALEDKVPQPATWENPPLNREELLKKARIGESCSEMKLISPSGYSASGGEIFQEFIRGTHASACLLARNGESSVLSINGQRIVRRDSGFEYMGGKIPLSDQRAEECARVASKAAEELSLSGYCGVDFVIGDTSYFMEINPRPTTSFVGLPPLLGANLGEMAVDVLLEDDPLPNPELRGCSAIKIPKLKKPTEVNSGNMSELRRIPEIVSPPFAPDGHLKEASTIFMAMGHGNDYQRVEKELDERIREALNLLEVEESAGRWD